MNDVLLPCGIIHAARRRCRYMSLLQHYSAHDAHLSEVESYCFKRILQLTMADKNVTIQYLADELNVSTTTIFRMCKKLGYASFKEFRYDFLYYKREDFSEQKDTIRTTLDHMHQQCEETFHLLEKTEITAAAQAILQAKKVLICSTGMNNYIAKILSIKLSLIGISNMYPDDQWFMYLESNHLHENDFVIVLSRAGETEELIKVVKSAQVNGAKNMLIGEAGRSTLADLADFRLSTSKVENEGYDIDTRLQMHLAVHYLTKELMLMIKEQNQTI